MEEGFTVRKFIRAFDGEFNRGIIKNARPRECDCLALYIDGEADYIFSGHALRVKTGDAFFIPAGSVYSIDVKEKSRYICINFDLFPSDSARLPSLYKKTGASAEGLFLKILRIRAQGVNLPRAMSILYEIYFELLKRENEKYSHSANMDKIYSVINEHLSDAALSVSDISAKTGISQSKIRRGIKSVFHLTPIKYITKLRLEKAGLMLTDSNLSVTETAYACGFDDPFYFSRCFKKLYGVSPREYKKNELK